MNPLLLFFAALSVFCLTDAFASDVNLTCKWWIHLEKAMQSLQQVKESFVVNLKKEQVYWVNANKRLPITEINEGRIVFSGEKRFEPHIERFLDLQDLHNRSITFIINRVTGKLIVEFSAAGSGECIAKKTVF